MHRIPGPGRVAVSGPAIGLRNPMWARVIPFAIYAAFLALGDVAGRLAPDHDFRWLYGARVGLVALALVVFARGYRELAAVRTVQARQWAVAVAAGAAVFVLWINLDAAWLTLGQSTGFDPRDASGRIGRALAAVRLAGAALVVPVMEELFWRSFLARWIDRSDFSGLDPRALSARALVVSSLVFGLEHNLWFAGVVAGLAYCALYRWSGSLWPAIAAHALTNALLGAWVLATGAWQFW